MYPELGLVWHWNLYHRLRYPEASETNSSKICIWISLFICASKIQFPRNEDYHPFHWALSIRRGIWISIFKVFNFCESDVMWSVSWRRTTSFSFHFNFAISLLPLIGFPRPFILYLFTLIDLVFCILWHLSTFDPCTPEYVKHSTSKQ